VRNPQIIAALIAASLLFSACGTNKHAGDKVDPDGTLTIAGHEPVTDLLPGNSGDLTSLDFLNAMYAGLLAYRPDGSTYNRMAESITTTDSKTYYMKIKKGWQFHDGTEVKAKNFVDAWNYTAYGPNGQMNGTFFEQIAGYAEVHPADPDGEEGPQKAPEPTAKTLSGLKIVGDYEFDVSLTTPFSVFTSKVASTPFLPLPDKFFADPKAFTKAPIGNGPMKFVSRTAGQDIKLTRFDGYPGENKVKFKDLAIRIYPNNDAAYKDVVTGSLDFMDTIPASAKVDGKYQRDLGDQVVPSRQLQVAALLVPSYRPEYTLDVRRAISMAINREQLIRTVLHSTNKPADGWVPEGTEGYEPNVCGEWCTYQPEKAKELFAKSGFTGKLTITANTDGSAKDQAEALCNGLKNVLGVECEFIRSTTFAQYRTQISERKLVGMGTTGWALDYPSIESVVNGFKTDAQSNDTFCSDKELDATLTRADATPDRAEAIKIYQQAHRMVVNDFCHIPLFFGGGIAVRSKYLKTATTNVLAHLDLATAEVLAR
jgi:oligopeptide transport system substrate-binding protein